MKKREIKKRVRAVRDTLRALGPHLEGCRQLGTDTDVLRAALREIVDAADKLDAAIGDSDMQRLGEVVGKAVRDAGRAGRGGRSVVTFS